MRGYTLSTTLQLATRRPHLGFVRVIAPLDESDVLRVALHAAGVRAILEEVAARRAIPEDKGGDGDDDGVVESFGS